MVTRRSFLYALTGAGLVGVGAVVFSQLPDETTPTGDPIIRYGEESCARCRMVISDVKYAAAWRQPDGSEEHFDDIGCMVSLNGELHMDVDTKYWAHDFNSEAWLDALNLSYVLSPEIKSPMGYGIAATLNSEDAQTLAETIVGTMAGTMSAPDVLNWNALQLAMIDAQ
ncbi:MAG: twin-arginine translocation signal domain-containing protein [Planctomycetaceae bacterium]|nr:MAG: twin-arginine translocation signal domain-containing protein [Planctomycetaceae bacterium]